jgi:hypothetical protein
MNDLQPEPVDVAAPADALAWSPEIGFITNADELLEVHGEGALVLDVEDGLVRAVEGETPLAVAIRQDRQITEAARELDTLRVALYDVVEHAQHRLTEGGGRS